MKVKIVGSRVVETPALGGGVTKSVWVSWETDTGLRDAFTMPFEEYTPDKALERAAVEAKHAAEIVGREVEVT